MLDPNTIALLNQFGIDANIIEPMLAGAAFFTVLALGAAVPTGIIAHRKGRSKTLWLLFALSIPVIPLLLVWLLPAVPGAKTSKEE